MGRLKELAKTLVPERIPWFAVDLYNQVAGTAGTTYYHRVSSEVVAELTSGRILDIGTGPGYLPIEIAKKAPAITIDGIDLSKKMVELARKNAQRAGVTAQVHFEVGNGNRLRFGDNLYDIVISTGAFHAWKKPIRVLNECWRVLKPGGEVWIYDPAHLSSGLRHQRKFNELLAWMWGWVTSRITLPYALDQVQAIASNTKFKHYEAEQTDWLRIKLIK